MTATLTRKPRSRSIRLIVPMNEHGLNGLLRITESGKHMDYFVDKIDADFGTAYRLEKWETAPDEPIDNYDVNLDTRYSTCECLGFSRHGHCKHIEGLTALQNAGKL